MHKLAQVGRRWDDDHVVVMDEDYYGTLWQKTTHTRSRHGGTRLQPTTAWPTTFTHIASVSYWQYCVAFWSHFLRTEPFLHTIMSGSALVGALTSGHSSGFVITSSKPESPAKGNGVLLHEESKWDSEAL